MATTKTLKRKRHRTWDDKILFSFTNIVLVFVLIITAYPLIYVVSCSFSSGTAVSSGQVFLWPVGFTLHGYKIIFSYKAVWTGFANTIFYTVAGTIVNLIFTTLIAYPLSRVNYQGRKGLLLLCTFSMMFSAGMVPKYMLISSLGLINNRLVMIIDGAWSISNMILLRTSFQNSIPGELIEAARLDGCSELRTLWKVVIPLSKATLAVITLYYAVGHWNAYFNAMLYLRDRDKYPVQIVLRDILNASKIDLSEIDDPELIREMAGTADLMKYALIVVTSAPVIAAYPFVQKFFKKGVMMGSLKG